ncbi:MAG: DinB family protein [Burkholderiaceae bacterium]|nr:DinB family protein [Burkholderiaceae bacterium]
MNARDHFLMLARYHVWATDRLLDRHVALLAEDEYRRDVGLFFKSVHGTLNHLLVAERGLWFERFANGRSPVHKLNEELHTERSALHAALKQAVREWIPAIESWDTARFDGALGYTSTEGVTRTVPFAPTLTHVFNHGTHHRGQISAALTMLGHPAPELDLLFRVIAEAEKAK